MLTALALQASGYVEPPVSLFGCRGTRSGADWSCARLPDTLIGALVKRPEVKNLTAVSNNAGVGHFGLGKLISSGAVS